MESIARRLDAEIRELAVQQREVLARVAQRLLEMKRGRCFIELGFARMTDYAAARLDFSARKTRDLVELAERAEGLPRVRDAFERGGITWTKLREIARIATPETESEWLLRAAELNSRELERAVAEAAGERAPKVRVVLELRVEEYADLEDAVRELRRERREALPREQAALELVRRGLATGGSGSRAGSPGGRGSFGSSSQMGHRWVPLPFRTGGDASSPRSATGGRMWTS